MKKYRMRASNNVSDAKWKKVKLTHLPQVTTNSGISVAMFKRECAEYDSGNLITEHERYLGANEQ